CCEALSVFFFSSRRRHTRSKRDWSSDVCSSDLQVGSVMRQWGSQVPWWRVIKADGTSHDYERAKAKWEAEGLVLRGRAVRMDLCGLDHRDLENLARK